MNDTPRETPAIPQVPTTRRSLGYSALLGLAQDLLIARFALARACDRLNTEDLLALLDEISETVDQPPHRTGLRVITPRDENL